MINRCLYPVDCVVSGWASWGSCSKTCGVGERQNSRTVTKQPLHGGRHCPALILKESCNTQPCPLGIREVLTKTGESGNNESGVQAELEVCDESDSCSTTAGGLDNPNLVRKRAEVDSFSTPELLGSCFEKPMTGNLRIKIGTYGRNLDDGWFIDWVIIKTFTEDFKCTIGGYLDNGAGTAGPSSRSANCVNISV